MDGAPGEIRTPDLLLRSVNQESSNTVAALLFCDLRVRLIGEICPVLLPRCSLVTYCVETQLGHSESHTGFGKSSHDHFYSACI